MTVDGTDFRVNEPWPYRKGHNEKFFSHKFSRAGLRYEVGVCIQTGDIVWLHGPFPAGMSDLKIFCIKLALMLLPQEKVVADRGYQGDPQIITPYNSPDNAAIQIAMGKARACHETINRAFKRWGALAQCFRNCPDKHGFVFIAIATMTQLEITHGSPPFQVYGYHDPVDPVEHVEEH
jgi:hypothetical protein